MLQYFEIGKVVNTHGVKGEIKVVPLTDDPNRFNKLKSAFIASEISENMQKYNFEGIKFHKNFVLLKLKGIDDPNEAEKLKDKFIIIDREDAVKLPEGSFFVCDLINCEVYDEKENKLGVLIDILQTGSNDVYVVRDENKKEILVPALKSVVKEVSIEDKKIIVELPQGLIDDEV
ncbi:ribosome maturation factor RimM [Acetivibrio cellulolyticus]|uniref:ribosome maturation factor RimM n=1 Tax=Acetivibrio cellulolyticus TaxID=35830 RepID=UPI0001E2D4FF|nr:ribosome maturation factor RimM [Acetivibrio cellulolyticus]